jgi:hypothetical protein
LLKQNSAAIELANLFTDKSNLYQSQEANWWKISPKSLISSLSLQKLKPPHLIILLVEVRNNTMKDYLSPDPTIRTPASPTTMSRNHSEATQQASLRDSSKYIQDLGSLFKIQHVYKYSTVLIVPSPAHSVQDNVQQSKLHSLLFIS